MNLVHRGSRSTARSETRAPNRSQPTQNVSGWARLRPVRLGVLAAIPLAFFGLFFAWPVLAMASRGLGGSHKGDLSGALSVLTQPRELRVLWFTLWMAALGTICSLALGLPAAHVLYRLKVPGSRLWRAIVITPFVLPTVVVGVAFRSLFAAGGPLASWGWDGTWQPIALAMVFYNCSVVVRTVGPVWASLDPRAGQAAAALGASRSEVFRTVTWPALRTVVAGAGVVVFLFCSTAFGIVLMLGGLKYSTIETEIYSLTVDFLDLRSAAVLSTLQFLVVAILLIIANRLRAGAGDPRRKHVVAARRKPGRGDIPAIGATVLVLAIILVPIFELVWRSLTAGGSLSFAYYRHLGDVFSALNMSWRIAVDAAILSLGLGIIVSAVLASRAQTAWGRKALTVLDAVFMLPLGMSAVTVGFGFLITVAAPPLNWGSSPMLIPVAQAVVALPLVVRTLVPVLSALDPRPREAAAALGASRLRAWMTADLPHLVRPVAAATGFAFAASLGEFGATSFLVQPSSPTLPVLIYQNLGRPGAENFGAGMAGAVILGGASALIMGIVDRLGDGAVGRM